METNTAKLLFGGALIVFVVIGLLLNLALRNEVENGHQFVSLDNKLYRLGDYKKSEGEDQLHILFHNLTIKNTNILHEIEVQTSFQVDEPRQSINFKIQGISPNEAQINLPIVCRGVEVNYCSGFDTFRSAATAIRAFWFPLDSIRVEYRFESFEQPLWKYVEIHNETDEFVFKSNPSVEQLEEYVILKAEFVRPASVILIVGLALLLSISYTVFILVTEKRKFALVLSWIVFVIFTGIARYSIIPESLVTPSVVEIGFVSIAISLLIMTWVKSSYYSSPNCSVFLSYRRNDNAHAIDRIQDRLEKEFAKGKVFRDTSSIDISENFNSVIEDAIECSEVFIVVIGQNWLGNEGNSSRLRISYSDDYPRREVESALKHNLKIIPVFIDGASMPDELLLPESIRPLVFQHGIKIRPDPEFAHDMGELVNYLRITN